MPANELSFVIVVDDRGTAVIQKFGQAATDADKKIKESGKKISKETADAWKNTHDQMTDGWNRWKTTAMGAMTMVGSLKIDGGAKGPIADFLKFGTELVERWRYQWVLSGKSIQGAIWGIGSALKTSISSFSAYTLLLELAIKLGLKLRELFKQWGEEQTAMAGSIKSGAEVDTKALKYLAEVAEEKGITMRELYKELNVEYGDQLAAIVALKKAGFDWSGVLERLGVLEKREKEAAAEAAKSYEELAKSMNVMKVEEVNKHIEELTKLLAWMEEQGGYSAASFETVTNQLEQYNKMLTGTKDELEELNELMSLYGLETQETATKKADDLVMQFKRLKEAGIDENTILWAMREKFEDVASLFERFGYTAPLAFTALADSTRGMLPPFDEVLAKIKKSRKEIPETAESAVDAMHEWASSVADVNTELEILPPTFEDVATRFGMMCDDIVRMGLEGFAQLIFGGKSFADTIKGLFNSIRNFVRDKVKESFVKGFDEIYKATGSLWSGIKAGWRNMLKWIRENPLAVAIMGAFGGLKEAAMAALGAVSSFLTGDWISGITQGVAAVFGAIKNLFSKPDWKKVGEEVGRDLGVGISEELSKKIAETAKEIGDRYAAISVHIADIMREVGLTTENFETFGKRAHDILTHFGQGIIDSATATKSLDDAFSELAKGAEDMGITFSRSMIDIIRHSRELGLEVKSISEFIDKKLSASIGGLSKMIKGMANSQDEFNRVARLTLAIFNEIIASGGSYLDAVSQIKECLDELAAKQEEWGFEGTEAYDELKKFANLVEANKDLVESVQGMTDAYSALGSIGALTSDLFADWQEQALTKYDQLIAAGFSENEALRMMAPTLNALAEAAKTYGYNISDSMQGLYDAADAQNLLKETNPFERMNDSLDRMVIILEKLAEHWGVMIDEVDAYKGHVEDLPTAPGYEGGGRGEPMQFGTPYVPYTGLYKLHQGEAVIPASQNVGLSKISMQMPIQIIIGGTLLEAEITQVVNKQLDIGKIFVPPTQVRVKG